MTDKFPSAAYCAGQRVRIEVLEAELRESRMQSLADLGQAQEAYEAQREAEAERDKLLQVLRMVVEEYDLTPSGLTLHSIDAHARPALRGDRE